MLPGCISMLVNLAAVPYGDPIVKLLLSPDVGEWILERRLRGSPELW